MPAVYIPFMIGLVTGWSMLNTIPSVLLGAPAACPQRQRPYFWRDSGLR
jgi:hypothetical protein